MNTQMQCCLCKSIRLILLKKSNFKNTLTSSDFAITDNRYGLVHDIYKCQNCNLIQCPNIKNVEKFYKDLKDSLQSDLISTKRFNALSNNLSDTICLTSSIPFTSVSFIL